ncbi:DoxX family protein [Phytohabitans rumicis]|uniref:DoxX family protein n=1 Tax=Phytohabitans rumicis TaxID=1076125 RepID=UPI0031EC4796
MRPVRTAARALLSGIFVASGARALADPEQLVPRAKVVTDRVAPLLERVDPRIPTEARTLVQLNGAMQVAGGLLLATGHFTRAAAAVLAGTMVPTTLAGHPFWTYEDPAERRVHQVQFLKNLGLVGGLLFAAVDTRGRPGLRYRTSHFVGNRRRALGRTVRTVRRDARIAVKSAAAARNLPG